MDLFYCGCKNFEGVSLKEMQHNAGRYIIKYAAENFFGIKNGEIEIINNKPAFKHGNIKFSVSHSSNLAAVCFDKNETGLDIEKIIPRNYIKIAERMNFPLKENSLNEFYKCWTLYEAEYKLQLEAKYKHSFIFKDEYFISVVSNKTTEIKKKLKLYEVTF